MSNLVLIKKQDNQEIPVTTSLIMAEGSENTHRSVYLLIEKYESDFEEFGRLSFRMTPLETKGGIQESKVYYLNENQALLLITYMRNNDVVRKLKIALIKEFSSMKNLLSQKQTQQWQDTRTESKLQNSALTDQINLFIEYAKSQGSQNASKYYTTIQKWANKAVGIQNGQRDYTDSNTLSSQMFIFNVLIKTMRDGMASNKPYKDISKDMKFRVEDLSQYVKPQQLSIGGK